MIDNLECFLNLFENILVFYKLIIQYTLFLSSVTHTSNSEYLTVAESLI